MRNSCLKMQQVIEASEGQDAGPQSSDADVSVVTQSDAACTMTCTDILWTLIYS